MKELVNNKASYTSDRFFHALIGQATLGLSPSSLLLAYYDWMLHLSFAPAKQTELLQESLNNIIGLSLYVSNIVTNQNCEPCIEPLPQDKRFISPKWQDWPFNLIYQSFLLNQSWWHNATTNINGVSHHHENAVAFAARQKLDMFSPSNFLLTNPEILDTTFRESGNNLIRGLLNLAEDFRRLISNESAVGTENFLSGKDIATTTGDVIYRNNLIELIQYKPESKTVYKEPILIVPAWIMKYYILDLSPNNSLVKYLVDKGHTVFIISWKNPDEEDSDLSLEDYQQSGINDALDAVSAIVPKTRIHTVGYCLGGTLLAIAAAAMAREGDDRIASLTLLAAQTDFEEAGELMLFIDESQVTFLEDLMWEQGYLDTKQMATTFHILRSNDLIWSNLLHDYLLGQRRPMTDLMAWNKDATRMPYKMHSQYLRKLFLNNELAESRYYVGNRPVAISDIRVPIFTVATMKDHVSPWKSVYKIYLLTDTEVTFLLTSGGHNAGIISELGHPKRRYRISTHSADDKYIDPNTWLQLNQEHDGSWWPAWQKWLLKHSTEQVKPPGTGSKRKGYVTLCPAPGTYIHY